MRRYYIKTTDKAAYKQHVSTHSQNSKEYQTLLYYSVL